VVEADAQLPAIVLQRSRFDSEGRAVYPEDVLALVDELRDVGVCATFQDPPDIRVYERLRGLTSDLVVPFAVSLTASGAWSAIAAFVSLKLDRQVKISVSKTLVDDKGARSFTFDYEGPASGAERMIRGWDVESDPD